MTRKIWWTMMVATALAAAWCVTRLAAQPPGPAREVTDQAGAYKVRLTEIAKVRRFVSYKEDQLSLQVSVSLETDETVLGASWPPLTAATDDTGASLLLQQAGGGGQPAPLFMGGFGGGLGQRFTLLAPAEKATEIAELKGTVKVAVSTGTEEVRFDQPTEARNVTLEKEGTKITLKSAQQEGNKFWAEVRVEGQRMGPGNVTMQIVGQGQAGAMMVGMVGGKDRPQFVLQGADGTEQGPNSMGGHGGGGGMEYRLEWHKLSDGFAPQALLCRFVKGQEEKEIPFEFQDIPLP